jgi:hypothetical protein
MVKENRSDDHDHAGAIERRVMPGRFSLSGSNAPNSRSPLVTEVDFLTFSSSYVGEPLSRQAPTRRPAGA